MFAWRLARVKDSALERGAKFPATIDHGDTRLHCIFDLKILDGQSQPPKNPRRKVDGQS